MLLLPKQTEHIFIRIPGFKGARIAHLTQWLDQGLHGSISSSYTRLAVRGLGFSQRCYSRIRIRSFWSVTLCYALGQWSVVPDLCNEYSAFVFKGQVFWDCQTPKSSHFSLRHTLSNISTPLFLKMNRAMGSLCANFFALYVHTQTPHSCLFRVSYHGPKEEHLRYYEI